MSRTTLTWLIIVAVYLTFFSWYPSFGGPLTEEEIDHYMALFDQTEPSLSQDELAMVRKFMEEDAGNDFVMINLVDLYETPRQIEGARADPGSHPTQVSARVEFLVRGAAMHPQHHGNWLAAFPFRVDDQGGCLGRAETHPPGVGAKR